MSLALQSIGHAFEALLCQYFSCIGISKFKFQHPDLNLSESCMELEDEIKDGI